MELTDRTNLTEAKKLVIQAGKRLIAAGLIQRTWGNVSCRISATQFVITPSGRSYLDLTPDEIVLVNLPDLTYEGSVLPSSEMRVHAAAYQKRPDANFIIHTHQEQASIASVLGVSSIPASADPASAQSAPNEQIPCAAYALPGTEALCQNTMEALARTTGNAVIMRHHGTLCLGKNCEESFETAFLLEKTCAAWLRFISANAPQQFPRQSPQQTNDLHINNAKTDKPTEAALRSLISRFHPEARVICRTVDPAVLFAVRQGGVASWLDDFAQMIGPSLTAINLPALLTLQNNTNGTPDPADPALKEALCERSAALITGFGGLCWGATETDAQSAKYLLEKNCRAFCYASLYRAQLSRSSSRSADFPSMTADSVRPIDTAEAAFMRQNYLSSYSKRLEKKI